MKRILFLTFSFVLFLLTPEMINAQGGDNAAAAAGSPITLPFAAAGTTCGRVDNYNPMSLYGITPDGNDWLYYFCAPSSGQIDVFMNHAYDYMSGVFIYSVTPNATGTNWFTTSFTGATYINSLVSFTATAGTCYYILVDNDFLDDGFNCFNYNINIQYHTNPPAPPLQPACTNIGYDNGNLSGWSGTTGVVKLGAAGAPTPTYTPLYYTTSATQHSVTSGAGVDPYGGFPIVNPNGGTNSIRLGDVGAFGSSNQYFGGVPGATGATLEQKFQVTASNALFVYYYAVVIQDAGADHTNQEQPFFKTDVFDCTGNPVPCGQYLVTGGPGIPGFVFAGSNVYYKTWTPVAVDLTPFIGSCVTVRYTVGDCTRGAHFAYAYIDAVCQPLAITGINQICPNKSTTLTAPTGLFTYSWTPGGQTTQSVVVSPTVATTYSVELTSYTNCKTFLNYPVTIFPAAVASANSATICAGTAAALSTTVNNGAGSYTWAPSGGNGSTASVSPGTTTNYTVTYSDSNGCQDTAISRVTVNPLPTMTVPPSTTICHNGGIPASAFSSTVAGTTYAWSNSNTSIGLAASGTGNTPAFSANNTGSSPVTAIISVTPTANSCVGTPITYSITVNPIPNVNAVSSSTFCSGATVPTTSFSGSVTATTFSWSNTNTTIGLGASGTGNVNSFTSSNTTANPITGVVTVTPSANTCVGIPTSFSILVNPIPNVTAVPNASYCSGATVPASAYTSSVTGTTFNWSNTNISIGLGASGMGNTSSFSSVNNGSTSVTGVVTVTPSANSCIGTPMSYNIVVNPIPNVNAVPSASYCSGASVPAASLTGSVASTTFNWANTNSTIGLATSGTGNVSSFTASNAGAGPVSGIITVTPSANSCIGSPMSYTLIVNPIPNVNAVTSASYCAGASVPASVYSGNVTGTTFNWSNTNTTIGLGASGVGNTPVFTAANSGAAPITGVVTVTPSANSCIGTPINYNIVVNPIPNVNAVTSASYCNNAAVPASNYSGNVTGTTFNWSNTNTTIGLAASGTGNAPAFTASNAGSTAISGVVTVTPSANSCVGNPTTYTITVNPTPSVLVPSGGTYCDGSTVPVSTFTGNVTGTTFSWSNSNTSVGLAASGTGNIPSFVATNTSASSVTTTIGVTPSANTCVGPTVNFNVTVNPKPVAPTVISTTVCSNQSTTLTATAPGGTYNWYDAPSAGTLVNTGATYAIASVTATSTYYVNATNVFGCVGPMSPVSATVLNVLATNAIPNQTICAGNSATLGVNPNGAGYSYSWDAPGSPAFSSIYNPVVSPAFTTDYTVTVTSPNGCVGSSQTKVTITPLPLANAGTPQTYCTGQSATIGSAPITGYNYSWAPATGLNSTIISDPTVSLTNSGSTPVVTIYTVTVSGSGCVSSNTVQVTINPLPVADAGTTMTLCATQSGTIGTNTTAGYSYSWFPGTNLNSTTIANPTVNGTNAGAIPVTTNYTVTTTEASTGCQSFDNVAVTVLPFPTVNAGSVATSCAGTQNLQLNGTTGGSVNSVLWTGGFGSFSPNNAVKTASYTPTAAEFTNGSLTLTLTAYGTAPCPNVSSPVTISFYPNPVISFTVNDPNGCPEHCVNFTDQSTIASPDFIQNWTWNFGDGSGSTTQNPSHCYEQTGMYSVTLTAISNHNCSTTMTIPQMIEVYPVPDASFIPSSLTVGVFDPTISFQNTSQGAASNYWNFGDGYATNGSNTSNEVNPAHTYSVAGEYTVRLIVTNTYGCVDEATIVIEVEPEFTFYIPNAFSPTATLGVNDFFTGMGIGIEKYEMWIFDRWGERIFYTDDIYKGWDGKVQGKSQEVQQDVYVWKVKLKDVLGRWHDYIGHVTVLR